MKISVITACYNCSEFVSTSIDSFNGQVYDQAEQVIVDGSSTDGSLEIIKENISDKHKYLSEPDKGVYDAMNKGIGLSDGEIIGFLNADDAYADSNVLSKVSETFKKYNVDSVYGDLIYTDKNLSKTIRYWKSGEYKNGSMRRGWMPPHPTFFVRKNVYERLGNFDLSYEISADYELMLRFLHKNQISTFYIPEVLVKMRVGGKSYKPANYTKKFREDYRAMKSNGIPNPFYCLALKNISKLPQFIPA